MQQPCYCETVHSKASPTVRRVQTAPTVPKAIQWHARVRITQSQPLRVVLWLLLLLPLPRLVEILTLLVLLLRQGSCCCCWCCCGSCREKQQHQHQPSTSSNGGHAKTGRCESAVSRVLSLALSLGPHLSIQTDRHTYTYTYTYTHRRRLLIRG